MTRLTGAADRARLRDRDPQAAPDTLVFLRRVAALRALTGGAR